MKWGGKIRIFDANLSSYQFNQIRSISQHEFTTGIAFDRKDVGL